MSWDEFWRLIRADEDAPLAAAPCPPAICFAGERLIVTIPYAMPGKDGAYLPPRYWLGYLYPSGKRISMRDIAYEPAYADFVSDPRNAFFMPEAAAFVRLAGAADEIFALYPRDMAACRARVKEYRALSAQTLGENIAGLYRGVAGGMA